VGQQLASTSAEFIRRGMNVAPTLEIRPGYPFTVMVTQQKGQVRGEALAWSGDGTGMESRNG
jgi:hypothetical protein